MEPLHVLITMDCEPAKASLHMGAASRDYPPTGPMHYPESERAIRGYWETAKSHGFPVTFFIHPESAQAHAQLYLDLQADGGCLGLHLHPWKLGDGKYDGHFGSFSAEDQRRMLSEAVAVWQEALGRHPLYFRPGTHSANDSSYLALCDLGFRGGGVSWPGRIRPSAFCVWAGAERYPHRAHPHFRQAVGDLPFVNLPLSVAYRRPVSEPGHFRYQSVRLDDDIDHGQVLREIIEEIVRDSPRHPIFNMCTHNDHDYSDPQHPWRKRFESVLGSIRPLCEEMGVKVVGSTVALVCERVLEA
jgi:peptidoglycan/xylan/chitin deacetylase (PgdA/CDA1 family)